MRWKNKLNNIAGVNLSLIHIFWNHQFNRSKVMKPHWHDEIELIYCNQGSFELSVNGEKKFVNTKQLVLINSNSIHRLRRCV